MRATKPAFARTHTGDFAAEQMQRSTREAVQRIGALTLGQCGPVIKGIVFPAGTAIQVKHQLGRKWSGYIVVRSYGLNVANAIGDTTQVGDPAIYATLITTLACTRDIVFF